jgi:hypothetical protein
MEAVGRQKVLYARLLPVAQAASSPLYQII